MRCENFTSGARNRLRLFFIGQIEPSPTCYNENYHSDINKDLQFAVADGKIPYFPHLFKRVIPLNFFLPC